jgi:hypothetical protein
LLSVRDIEAGLFVARNPHPSRSKLQVLPSRLRHAVEHPLPSVRAGAVIDLSRLAQGNDSRLRTVSAQVLELLCNDDSRSVSEAAQTALFRVMPPTQEPAPDQDQPPGLPLPDEPASVLEPSTASPAGSAEDTSRDPPGLPPSVWLPPARSDWAIPPSSRGRRRPLVVAAAIGLVIAIAALAAAFALRGPLAPQSTRQSSTIDVPGTHQWTDTGVDVASGQRVEIAATGIVFHDPAASAGPEGAYLPVLQQYSVLPSVPHAALIGKVGADGQPFAVGRRAEVTIHDGGRLFLGVNDKEVDNNSGKFTATIEVYRS